MAKPSAHKVVILSPYPPSWGKAASRGAALAHAFDAAGGMVTTLDAPSTSFAAEHIHFAPKRRYLREADPLVNTPWDIALLAPAVFDLRRLYVKGRFKRAIVALRQCGLLWRLGWKARKVILVRGGPHLPTRLAYWPVMLALALLRPHAVRITKARDPLALAQRYLGPIKPVEIHETDGNETLLRLAGSSLRHGPAWLSRAVGMAKPQLRAEVRPILSAVQRHAYTSPAPFQKPLVTQQIPNCPAPLCLVLGSPDVPIPALALHMRSVYRSEQRFHLGTRAGRERMLTWYVNQGPELVGAAIPLPPAVLQAYHNILCHGRTRRSLFADLQAHFPHLGARLGAHDDAGNMARDFATLLYLARFSLDLAAVAPKAVRQFSASLPGGILNVFQLMAATLGHAPVDNPEALNTPWAQCSIAQWFADVVIPQAPALAVFSTLPAKKPPKIVRITAPTSTTSGLAANAEMSARALAGISVNRPIALHHVNADAIPRQILRHGTGADFNIGFLLWEADQIPLNHYYATDLLDAIWAPSQFVADIYTRAFDRPVTRIGKAIELPQVAPLPRAQLGLGPEHHIVLSLFDAHSSIIRKNPLATLRGFQAAFAGDASARLIIKTTPLPAKHWGDPERQMAALTAAAARDPRVIIDTRFVPFADLLALIAMADTLVSTHRGEGFGYIPAYAMALGTPVAATDYSGTQDYVSPKTAWPLPWHPRNIRPGETIFPLQSGHWAEVQTDALAETLLRIRADKAEASARAQAGQTLIRAEYSFAAQTARYRAALGDLGLLTECSSNVHVNYGPEFTPSNPTPRPRPTAGAGRVPASANA